MVDPLILNILNFQDNYLRKNIRDSTRHGKMAYINSQGAYRNHGLRKEDIYSKSNESQQCCWQNAILISSYCQGVTKALNGRIYSVQLWNESKRWLLKKRVLINIQCDIRIIRKIMVKFRMSLNLDQV